MAKIDDWLNRWLGPAEPARRIRLRPATQPAGQLASDKQRAQSSSLLARLFWGFTFLLALIWLLVLATSIIAMSSGRKDRVQERLDGEVRQILAWSTPLLDRPDVLRHTATQVAAARIGMFRRLGLRFPLQTVEIRHHGQLIFQTAPSDNGTSQNIAPQFVNVWASASASDDTSGLQVTLREEIVGTWMLSADSMGFYFALPLLLSLPILFLPAWLLLALGLKPLKRVGRDIAARSDTDLSPLPPTPYRELSPIVSAVNHLMQRLSVRLEREQEFLLDAAHELKTPLAVIQLNAETLTRSPDPQRRAEASSGLQAGLQRATHTVHQLLALARTEGDEKSAVWHTLDLVALLRDRIALVAQIALPRQIDLALQSPESGMIEAQRESLAAMIDNLLGNAVKYSPDGGRVEVVLQSSPDGWQLRVLDEGPGIAPALREKVFERFFRAPDQTQTGSGLGLAIVQQAIRLHAGDIRLEESWHGRGLAVTVTLPLQAPHTKPLTSAKRTPP